METRRERKPTRCFVPNPKSEIAISSILKEAIESSKGIRKKPLKYRPVARHVYADLGDLSKSTLKISPSSILDCSKDPDVTQAADLLTELSSSASSSSGPPIWSDEMYPWPQPEVVRLKLKGALPLELPLAPPPLVRQNAFCGSILVS